MNTTWFKHNRLFVIALLISLAHFILTSVLGHYIVANIGTQVGQIVAGGFIESYDNEKELGSGLAIIHFI